jgi:hypothetical protein
VVRRPKNAGPQTPVDLVRALEDAAPDQGRNRQEYAGAWQRLGRAEKRRRVVEQAQTCQQAIASSIGGIAIRADRGLGDGRRRKSGQVCVRTHNRRLRR